MFIAIIGVGCLLILLIGNTIPAVRAATRSPTQVDPLPVAGQRRARNANG